MGSLGSLHGSPATSTTSLPHESHPIADSPCSGTAAAARQRGRNSSQAEAAPAVSHFSIAAVMKGAASAAGGGQRRGAAAAVPGAAVPGAAKSAAAPAPQQSQGSIEAEATWVAQHQRKRSGGEASFSRRPTSAGGSWGLPAVRGRLGGMSLKDGGSACVPLEVASPLRGACGASASAAAEHDSPAQQAQHGQQQPLTADDYHARGYALRKRGDFEGAVREYSRALALDPAHFKCLFNRAFSLDKVWLVAGGAGGGVLRASLLGAGRGLG